MKIVSFVLLLIFLPLTIVIGFVYYNSQPVSLDTSVKNFVVNQGDGIKLISQRLESGGFVRNQYVFLFHAYRLGLASKLQSGLFKLSSSLSNDDIIAKLSSGGSHDYWLKIIGGQRIEQISPRFDSSYEGYLFPDSYLIPQDYSVENIFSVINKNFVAKFTQAKVGATNTSMTDAEIITLASLIEREARTLVSKRQVAGVIINRLNIDMPLQLDATAQYARDSRLNTKSFWEPVTKADLRIISPYNTYLNTGLPPGPICNPGYDSIYAALHPTESDYLYYITGNDNQMHYAKTLDEHNVNIGKYLR